MSDPLRFDVCVSAQTPVVTDDLPPGVAERRWSPISSTLISGERDAVLVDTFITLEQNRTLVEWIAEKEKSQTTFNRHMATGIISLAYTQFERYTRRHGSWQRRT